MSTDPQRVVFLGAGAIGAGVGGLLWDAGVDVLLIARGAHGRALAEEGLDLRLPGGPRRLRVPVGKVGDVRPDDLVVLATMGHDTTDAVATLPPDVPLVSFQNGLAPLEELDGREVIAGMLYVPAERRAPGVVVLAGSPHAGAIFLGRWPSSSLREIAPVARWRVPRGDDVAPRSRAPARSLLANGKVNCVDLSSSPSHGPRSAHSVRASSKTASGVVGPEAWFADALTRAGFRAEVFADIAPWIRAKCLTNLGGIHVALCDAPPMDVLDATVEEARAVFRAQGVDVIPDAAFDERIGPMEVVAVDGLPRVGGSTRHALARGDRLETEWLHGYFVRLGERLGVPTPINAALVALAAQATAERWAPGCLSAQELRDKLGFPVPS